MVARDNIYAVLHIIRASKCEVILDRASEHGTMCTFTKEEKKFGID
jgi:hypothetical protein